MVKDTYLYAAEIPTLFTEHAEYLRLQQFTFGIRLVSEIHYIEFIWTAILNNLYD
jgi:hypothetical protein